MIDIFFIKLMSGDDLIGAVSDETSVKLLKGCVMRLLMLIATKCYNKFDETMFENEAADSSTATGASDTHATGGGGGGGGGGGADAANTRRFWVPALESVIGNHAYTRFASLLSSLQSLCNKEMIYMLVVIIMFEPSTATLDADERRIVEQVHRRYSSALYSYMCDYLGVDNATEKNKRISSELGKLSDLARWFERSLFHHSNFDAVRPLIRELFNLPTASAPDDASSSSSLLTSPRVASSPIL